jgi:GNAT superfamily N-acetyltransferase
MPKNHLTIRLATPEDKSRVLNLFDQFSSFLGSSDTPSKIGGPLFDEIVAGPNTMIFVAEDDDQLVGLATFYLLPNIRHAWHRGHIEDLFVSPSIQGKGIGSAIFSAVKDYCHEHNIHVIKLDSGNELTAAHRFYEKQGGRTSERFFRFDLP